jgi:hypothetical protein
MGAPRVRTRSVISIATRLWICVVAAACTSGVLGAQSVANETSGVVLVGARVRLWELAARDLSVPVVGRLTRLTADSIDIQPDGNDATIVVARPAVTRVETSEGPHTRSRTTAAVMGAVIGALGGGVLGVIAGNMNRSNAARLGIYAGVAGAGIGAVVGASAPGEAWHRATLPAP